MFFLDSRSPDSLYLNNRSLKSGVYTLMFGSHKIPVYCHMGNFRCGDGGWTLAMKIDGTKVNIFPLLAILCLY